MHLLVVVDDSVLRRGIAIRLRDAGFVVDAVGTAEECIRRIRVDAPSLIVLGDRSPDGSGSELMRVMRSLSTTAKVPIVSVPDPASEGPLSGSRYVDAIVARARALLRN